MSTETMDKDALLASTARVLGARRWRRAGYDGDIAAASASFHQIATTLGWTALYAPEPQGGLGQPFETLAAVYEQTGRTLAPTTLASAMASLEALSCCGPDGHGLVSAIVNGTLITPVLCKNCLVSPDGVATGSIRNIADAQCASNIVLLPDNGPAVVIKMGDSAVDITPVELWDRSRAVADITFQRAMGVVVATSETARVARTEAAAHCALAGAWDSIGGADQIMSELLDYLALRRQFGRSIASFQAVKHRLADLKMELELARAFVRKATGSFARRECRRLPLAEQARVMAAEVYVRIAEDAVQLHGGIGFTWEHDCHLFLKRAYFNLHRADEGITSVAWEAWTGLFEGAADADASDVREDTIAGEHHVV